MPQQTIDILGLNAGTPKGSDQYPAVDVTDTSQSAIGTTKKYQLANLLQFFLTSLGFNILPTTTAATTFNLNATYNNGIGGINATLTDASGTFAPFTIDGIAGVVGTTPYLIKNQLNQFENGIYFLQQNGDGISVPWRLIRVFYFNSNANIINGQITFVISGATQANTMWQLTAPPVVVVGISNLIWSPFVLLSTFVTLPLMPVFGGTGVSSPAAHSILIAEGAAPFNTVNLANGQLLIGSTGLDPVANTLTAGPGISIANAAGAITISSIGGGIPWTEVLGPAQLMVPDNGYVANNAGLVTLTLPVLAAFGTTINIVGKGAGGWRIQCNGGQIVRIGNAASSAGGSVSSTNRFDSVELLCTTANTTWTAASAPQGNLLLA